MKIAYTKAAGVADNIRRVDEGYQPAPGELLIEHDSNSMPTAQSLSDPRTVVRRVGYFKTDGRAHDIRIVPEDHTPAEGELFLVASDALPTQDELSDPPSLATTKARAATMIDMAAGQARLKYITAVPGQDATYQLKSADAKGYKGASYPVSQIDNFPMVKAEAEAVNPHAPDYEAAAKDIIATEAMWVQLAAIIEKLRRGGKIAVDAASDSAAVDTVRASVIAALNLV